MVSDKAEITEKSNSALIKKITFSYFKNCISLVQQLTAHFAHGLKFWGEQKAMRIKLQSASLV